MALCSRGYYIVCGCHIAFLCFSYVIVWICFGIAVFLKRKPRSESKARLIFKLRCLKYIWTVKYSVFSSRIISYIFLNSCFCGFIWHGNFVPSMVILLIFCIFYNKRDRNYSYQNVFSGLAGLLYDDHTLTDSTILITPWKSRDV